jgi:lysophospholipase L1-like esterase
MDRLSDAPSHTDKAERSASRTTTARRRISGPKKVVFALTTVALVVAAAELVFRLLDSGGAQEVASYISDWHRMPDGRTFWVVRGPGYNADGMRDREHERAKPEGVHRIVCLGDSVTAGHGVKPSERCSAYLEADLRRRGLAVEVFNVAASGWSTHQELTAYRAVARRYQPDHVFLGFCLNDVAEMNNNLQSPPPALARFLARHSALARRLVGAERRQVSRVEELLADSEPPAVCRGWKLVFDELHALKQATSVDGCDLSVLIFPFRFQLLADGPPPRAQRKLAAFCREQDIPCLDLLPALRAIGPSAFIDESHLSPLGARAAAERIVRWGQSGCVWCGFDLTETTSDRCPNCGKPVEGDGE